MKIKVSSYCRAVMLITHHKALRFNSIFLSLREQNRTCFILDLHQIDHFLVLPLRLRGPVHPSSDINSCPTSRSKLLYRKKKLVAESPWPQSEPVFPVRYCPGNHNSASNQADGCIDKGAVGRQG